MIIDFDESFSMYVHELYYLFDGLFLYALKMIELFFNGDEIDLSFLLLITLLMALAEFMEVEFKIEVVGLELGWMHEWQDIISPRFIIIIWN